MKGAVLRVFFILALFLIIVNLFSYVLYGTAEEPVRFSTVLERIGEAPVINADLNATINVFKITADWSLFNGLRDFINSLGAVIGLIVYLVSLLIDLGIFVGYALYVLGLSSVSALV